MTAAHQSAMPNWPALSTSPITAFRIPWGKRMLQNASLMPGMAAQVSGIRPGKYLSPGIAFLGLHSDYEQKTLGARRKKGGKKAKLIAYLKT